MMNVLTLVRDDRLEESACEEPLRLDFVHYSSRVKLLPGSASAPDQAGALVLRGAETRPVREVRIDVEQMDRHLAAFYEFDPQVSEQYSRLSMAVVAAAQNDVFKRILVASAHRGDGRTCVTLNLAAALARTGRRVLVVDSDMFRPSLLHKLGAEAELDLIDILARGLTPRDVALRVLPHDFDLLPLRARVDNRAEVMSSGRLQNLLRAVQRRYDFILFDSPPLLEAGDASLLLPLMDRVLLVLRPGKTSSAQMAHAVSGMTQDSLLGVVMNRCLPPKAAWRRLLGL